MEENNYVPFISEVETFNDTMGKPNNYVPVIPDKKEWEFVYNFILEELEEYKEACESGDIIGILDALCDITYVSLGNGAMLHGLKDKMVPAYQEVQASNMSKACKDEAEAKETVRVRSEQQGEPCHYEKVNEYWIVFPEQKVIEVFVLKEGKYSLLCSTENTEGVVSSIVLQDFKSNVSDIFEG